MATVLEKYQARKQELIPLLSEGKATTRILWQLCEVTYRISIMETFRLFCDTAPVTTEMKTLQLHYRMLDAFIQNVAQERSYGPNRGPDTEKERSAARTNLDRIIQDYRRRFSSFNPTFKESYQWEIGGVVKALMPAWIQMRETFVPLKAESEEEKKK